MARWLVRWSDSTPSNPFSRLLQQGKERLEMWFLFSEGRSGPGELVRRSDLVSSKPPLAFYREREGRDEVEGERRRGI